ncbi:MAG: pyrimidine/purine nucleoside phosphorylase, partial [Neisseriaceae bacterium]|nr:pyrimidine/purine nucleoside phosphorylase [Neisseriaceae bacterium]
SIGVIFPSSLEFNTQASEVMEIISGQCRVQLADTDECITYGAGERFSVAGNSHFKIETIALVNYICHFG